MKKLATLALGAILIFGSALSQGTTPPPPPEYGWQHSLVAGLTLTQVAFTDWAQGGVNALAYTLSADGKSVDDEEKSNWMITYKFAFGQVRLGGQGLRKADDIIDVATVYTYKLGTLINPYASATMKTQFAKGYMYPRSDSSVQVSAFFDPGYLMQSAGVGYQPLPEIKTRLGFALREIITNKFNQYSNDPGKKTSVDGGMESVTEIEWKLDDNILFTTKLEVFDAFKHFDEIVVRDNTSIIGKVNKYVTAMLNIQLINEKRVTPRTQVKETIALGLNYTLF
jgi:hypothetical protein